MKILSVETGRLIFRCLYEIDEAVFDIQVSELNPNRVADVDSYLRVHQHSFRWRAQKSNLSSTIRRTSDERVEGFADPFGEE